MKEGKIITPVAEAINGLRLSVSKHGGNELKSLASHLSLDSNFSVVMRLNLIPNVSMEGGFAECALLQAGYKCPLSLKINSPGSSTRGISQARILEWVAISFSRGSSRLRDQTQVSGIAGRCFNL